jgi:propionyl-CoA carboxylase alpha chain
MTTPPLPRPIRCVLVANRGEIARRVFRTCVDRGIDTVAVFSDADADAPFVRAAGAAVRLPGTAAADTYLRGDLIIAAAQRSGADAVHPGYGFLSENADFAELVIAAGLTWIGPPPDGIRAMGSKIAAKALMRQHGVPVAPDNTVESLDEIGLPALVKASAGGGGRGMRLVRTASELADAIASAEREAAAAFGDATVFVERYVEGGRHVEIQIFGDRHGTVVALGERDCTLQRRHQKVLEESPSPAVTPELRERMFAAAVAAGQAVSYEGAGTVEFMLAPGGEFFFLEMNTRLQVEHRVTEMRTGLDLVDLQLRVAAGERLDIAPSYGHYHAIEVRLCAEDPANGYRPSTGRFHTVHWAMRGFQEIDSAIDSGTVVPPFYDSMIAKLIAAAPTRAEAARLLATTLRRSTLHGPTTNREQLIDILDQLCAIDDPANGVSIDTGWLDRTTPPGAPSPTDVDLAAVAIAVLRAAPRPTNPPIGWRNNPSQLHTVTLAFDGAVTTVGVGFDRDGAVNALRIDDRDITLDRPLMDAIAAVDLALIAEADEQLVFIDHGRISGVVAPRFTPPDDAGRAGSTVSPMPGTLRRLLVAVGDVVPAGQPLVVIEAMKMEHQVVAPAAGVVAEVFVVEGQQLDHGQPLVRVDPASDDAADAPEAR